LECEDARVVAMAFLVGKGDKFFAQASYFAEDHFVLVTERLFDLFFDNHLVSQLEAHVAGIVLVELFYLPDHVVDDVYWLSLLFFGGILH